MILITGSKGKVGKSLVNYLKKNKLKIVETQRSKNYRVISDRCIGLDLLNKHHLKKLFNKFNPSMVYNFLASAPDTCF